MSHADPEVLMLAIEREHADKRLEEDRAVMEKIAKALEPKDKPADPVNHPAHYTRGGLEVIDAIEAWGLDFHRGNAVKYIARAGHKDPAKELEDLKKARWYLERSIARIEGGGGR